MGSSARCPPLARNTANVEWMLSMHHIRAHIAHCPQPFVKISHLNCFLSRIYEFPLLHKYASERWCSGAHTVSVDCCHRQRPLIKTDRHSELCILFVMKCVSRLPISIRIMCVRACVCSVQSVNTLCATAAACDRPMCVGARAPRTCLTKPQIISFRMFLAHIATHDTYVHECNCARFEDAAVVHASRRRQQRAAPFNPFFISPIRLECQFISFGAPSMLSNDWAIVCRTQIYNRLHRNIPFHAEVVSIQFRFDRIEPPATLDCN